MTAVRSKRVPGNDPRKNPAPSWCDPPFIRKTVLKSELGPLKLGEDDHTIERVSIDNLTELVHLKNQTNDGNQIFVAIEQDLSQAKPRAIYSAPHMHDAIERFQSEFGRHFWLPDGERDESQIGVPRRADSTKVIRISKMTKDSVAIN